MPFRIDYGVQFYNNETGVKTHSYYGLGLYFKGKTIELPKRRRHLVKTERYTHDLTKDLYDEEFYENRKIKLEFMFLGAYENWEIVMEEVMRKIHGKNMEICFDTGNYIYRGYCEIDKFSTNRSEGTISVVVDASPYRYESKETNVRLISITGGRSGSAVGTVPAIAEEGINPMNECYIELFNNIESTNTLVITCNGRKMTMVKGEKRKKLPAMVIGGDKINFVWAGSLGVNNNSAHLIFRKAVL